MLIVETFLKVQKVSKPFNDFMRRFYVIQVIAQFSNFLQEECHQDPYAQEYKDEERRIRRLEAKEINEQLQNFILLNFYSGECSCQKGRILN